MTNRVPNQSGLGYGRFERNNAVNTTRLGNGDEIFRRMQDAEGFAKSSGLSLPGDEKGNHGRTHDFTFGKVNHH